jgi:hypothetical protein
MTRFLLAALLATGALCAQSNAVSGLDGRMTSISNFSVLGTNATEVGFAARNDMCNVGSIDIPWYAAMSENHPKFGFMLARELNGRFEQISDWSFCKHAFTSVNGSGVCGPCQNPGTGTVMGINCTDAYGVGNNGDRYWLGPPEEIDPWLGTWNHVGSYFDRGFPDVGLPANNDGVRSNINPSDSVMNRVTVKKTDLAAGGTFFYQIHLIHEGEPVANRGDNLMTRQTTISGSGSSWSAADAGSPAHGSILTRWTGASVNSASNGNDDGRFFVGSKVTPLGGNNFRYDYAVHNVDNSRAGASFRVPLPAGSTATNFYFRDIDDNALNQWTASQIGNEVVFSGPAGNPLEWNTIYNFAFDCDAAPGGGAVHIDEARIGPGALSVTVVSDIPGGAPVAFASTVGSGCGGTNCDMSFHETFTTSSFDLNGLNLGMSLSGNSYNVGTAATTYVAPSGSATTLSLGDDATAQVSLPFSFPYPGGTTNSLWVCSNGFVSAGASNGNSYNPTSGELHSVPDPMWAACWHDLNPSAAGAVRVDSSATSVRITYDAVRSFSGSGLHTFQLVFSSNGSVDIHWQSITTSGNGYVVGYSPGTVATVPAQRDISADVQTGFSICDNPTSDLQMSPNGRPVTGTTMNLDTSNVPAGSNVGLVLLSLVEAIPPQDLTAMGMPGCFGYLQGGTVHQLVIAPSAAFSTPFSVPNNSAFLGVGVVGQTVTLTPGLNALGAASSNGVRLLVGAL